MCASGPPPILLTPSASRLPVWTRHDPRGRLEQDRVPQRRRRGRHSDPGQWKEKRAMSTEQNKSNVVRWYEEIWNKRNLDIVDELVVPEYVGHLAGIPGPVNGREALKGLFAA